MSSPLSPAADPAVTASPGAPPLPAVTLARPLPAWLREPLLHFALFGALVFAIDYGLATRRGDPNAIVVSREVAEDAKKLFRASRGQEPSADELRALTQRWVDNEILYREGLALQVDQGDTMIRDRVIFKTLMLVQTGLKLPPADDQTLRAWFETQRARYDEPARFDFQEAVMPAGASEATLRAFAQTLNMGTPGDTQAGLRVFKARPQANLEQSYGAEFAKALAEAPAGEWRALATRDGLRVVRLDQVTPPRPAQYEPLRPTLMADWTDATMAQMRTDAVRARGQKYTVRHEGAAP